MLRTATTGSARRYFITPGPKHLSDPNAAGQFHHQYGACSGRPGRPSRFFNTLTVNHSTTSHLVVLSVQQELASEHETRSPNQTRTINANDPPDEPQALSQARPSR